MATDNNFNPKKINIFEYLNYRQFLKDHYTNKKQKNPTYSYRLFNSKAGLQSPIFYKLISEGKRDLTEQSIAKFIKGLDLKQKEGLFFRNLVLFNQAKSNKDKALYYGQICHFRNFSRIHNLTADQYDLFYNWYNLVIYEMTKLKNFRESPQWIVTHIKETLSLEQAEASLSLLKKLGLLIRDAKTFKYKAAKPNLSTEPEELSVAVFKYHKDMIAKALDSLANDHHSIRDISSLTIALNEETFQQAKKMIQDFRRDLNVLFSQSKNNDRVYQLNFQIFPLTKIKG